MISTQSHPISKTFLYFLVLFCMPFLSQAQLSNYQENAELVFDLIPFVENDLYGFVNRENMVVIPAQYEKVSLFNSYGLAQAEKQGVYGIINKKGEVVVPFIASSQIKKPDMRLSNDPYAAFAKDVYHIYNSRSKKWCLFFDGPEAYCTPVYYSTKPEYNSQLSNYYSDNPENKFFRNGYKKIFRENGMVNFIDIKGNEIFTHDLINGEAISENLFIKIDKNGRSTLIDGTQTKTLSGEFLQIYVFRESKEHFVVNAFEGISTYEKKYGAINKQGKLIIDTIYSNVRTVNDSQFIVKDKTGVGVLDKNAKVLIEPKYKELSPFGENGYFYTDKTDYQKYIIKIGSSQKSKPYKNLTHNFDTPFLSAESEDGFYAVDENGQELFEISNNTKFRPGQNGHIIISDNGKHGILNLKGNEILPMEYDRIDATRISNSYLIKSGEQTGIFSYDGKWVHEIGEYRIVRTNDYKLSLPIYKCTTSTEEVIYTNDLSNKTVKKYDSDNYGRIKLIHGKEAQVLMSDGSTKIIPYNEKQTVYQHKDWLYITEKRADRKRNIYNENAEKLNPDDFYLSKIIESEKGVFFVLERDRESLGVMTLSGEWLFEPSKVYFTYRNSTHWVRGARDSMALYTIDGKQLSKSIYRTIDYLNPHLYKAMRTDNLYDLLDHKGQLVLSSDFSKIDKSGDYLISERNDILESCLIDSLGQIVKCYPYSRINPPNTKGLLIAKDLHDYGVIDNDGNIFIPFKYKSISQLDPLSLYALGKGHYNKDLITFSKDPVLADVIGYLKPKLLRDDIYYINGETETFFLKASGKFLGQLSNSIGKVSLYNALKGSNLVLIKGKDSSEKFYDLEKQIVYGK